MWTTPLLWWSRLVWWWRRNFASSCEGPVNLSWFTKQKVGDEWRRKIRCGFQSEDGRIEWEEEKREAVTKSLASRDN